MDLQEFNKRIVSQNIMINIIGNVIPMIVAIVTIPVIINGIGNEKFGILSIAWLFLGYFSILDLGIGRATTKFVLEYYSKGLINEVKSLVSTSVFSLIIFGVIIGFLLSVFTPYIVEVLLNIPLDLREETYHIFYAISFAVPFVVGVAGVRGVLEAQQKFRLLNIIKIPASILNYLIPAVVAFFSADLFITVLLLMITRVLLLLVYAYFCFSPFKGTGYIEKIDRGLIRKLVSYGGWLTISNLVGPVMVYFDRFIIGSILTLTLLTYYSTPYEVITKLLVLAGSATGVLFPVFTSLFLRNSPKLEDTYKKSLKGILFILFPLTLLFASFSYDILYVWLDQGFAENSSVVLQLLSVGVLLNSISAMPFTALQAANRPDLTAKVHIIELPLYIIALVFLAKHFGINGVAMAWMLRNFVDVTLFMLIYQKSVLVDRFKPKLQPIALLFLFLCLCFFCSYLLTEYSTFLYRMLAYFLMMVTFCFAFWKRVLNLEERMLLTGLLKKFYA